MRSLLAVVLICGMSGLSTAQSLLQPKPQTDAVASQRLSEAPQVVATSASSGAAAAAAQAGLATLDEVLASGRDLWGEAAMAQPNGASYEFFRDLLPPPRYVHADFRYYPIVLSAPRSPVKARLISNGSGLNLNGGSRSWKDIGTPVTFRVGPDEFRFGDLADRVSLPTLAEGYLPLFTIDYRHPFPFQAEGAVPLEQQPRQSIDEVYRLEAFASTAPGQAEAGVVWLRFSLAAGTRGLISLDVNAPDLQFAEQTLRSGAGQAVVFCDAGWKWSRGLLSANLTADSAAIVAIATSTLDDSTILRASAAAFQQQRVHAIQTWERHLSEAMQVKVPEPLVDHAWRNLLIQNWSLINKDRIFYSASNQYEQLYEAEGSDAALALLAWGYEDLAREVIGPLLDFQRAGLASHIASLKIMDMVSYYWQTRDTRALEQWRGKWQPALDFLIKQREADSGLLPKERYCGDISTPVYSLSAQAKAWRALHDMAVVLAAMGDQVEATRCRQAAAELNRVLQAAVRKSVRHEVTPPFVPIALLDKEPIHDPITEVRIGSYWNIIMPYVIGSRIFPAGSVEETWIPEYIQQHGGICMGMTRSGGTSHGFWTGPNRVNPLYGTRYVKDLLRRDQVERALVSFYGMLAQGFTRNTLIVGEGCTLQPVDAGGRFFYCPPNTAGNAHFLTMLRNLLVQDWDSDGDGIPETLRLMAATPRRWLSSGQTIEVEGAPTAFGKVSCRLQSELVQGRVVAEVELPDGVERQPSRIELRARLPEGYRCTGALCDGQSLAVDATGTVNLTGRTGRLRVEFSCQ